MNILELEQLEDDRDSSFVPFFNLIITIIRPLHMPFEMGPKSSQHLYTRVLVCFVSFEEAM